MWRTVVTPAILRLYGCEIWSHTLKAKCRLTVVEETALEIVFRLEGEWEITGGQRNLGTS
jgi:hypothetical protein